MLLVWLGSLAGYPGALMPEPMYRQIADDLREQIESGTLARGSQLPTELELRKSTKPHATPSAMR